MLNDLLNQTDILKQILTFLSSKDLRQLKQVSTQVHKTLESIKIDVLVAHINDHTQENIFPLARYFYDKFIFDKPDDQLNSHEYILKALGTPNINDLDPARLEQTINSLSPVLSKALKESLLMTLHLVKHQKSTDVALKKQLVTTFIQQMQSRTNETFINLAGIVLKNQELNSCNFSNVNLENSEFDFCDMRYSNFQASILDFCTGKNNDFFESNFSNASIQFASLTNCELRECNFTGANLKYSEFHGDCRWMILVNANIQHFSLKDDNHSLRSKFLPESFTDAEFLLKTLYAAFRQQKSFPHFIESLSQQINELINKEPNVTNLLKEAMQQHQRNKAASMSLFAPDDLSNFFNNLQLPSQEVTLNVSCHEI